jgi:UDP-glucose 4-epimerase
MRVCITGGAGFIGAHSAEALLAAGHSVRVLDNLSTGLRGSVPVGSDYVEGDVLDAAARDAAMRGCDAVLHLAALVSVPESIREPYRAFELNSHGTVGVLETARSLGIRRVVLASTSAIYGNMPGHKHEDSPIDPLTPYAESKLMAERACQNYALVYGMSIVRLRYFNVYGPRQRADSPYSGVLARWFAAIQAGQPCGVYGDGEQTRDFVHVRDVAAANAHMLAHNLAEGACPLFIVASGQSVTLNTVLARIGDALGKPVAVNYGPPRDGDIRLSSADPARLIATGWRPQVALADGIAELVRAL